LERFQHARYSTRIVRVEKLRPETTLSGDLGTDGDDGVELLEGFGRKFSVDMSSCDPRSLFRPRGLLPVGTDLLDCLGIPQRLTGGAGALGVDQHQ